MNTRRKGILLVVPLLFSLLFTVTLVMPVEACHPPQPSPLEIEKTLFCLNNDGYSDQPPYYVGNSYRWWIKITVTNTGAQPVNDVVVWDKLGRAFMLDAICVGVAKDPEHPQEALVNSWDYTFLYGDGCEPNMPVQGNPVIVKNKHGKLVADGVVNRRGVRFAADLYNGPQFPNDVEGFRVRWRGRSAQVQVTCYIGTIDAGQSKVFYLVVSTDCTPDGEPALSEPGIYKLNKGAIVRGRLEGTRRRVRARSNRLEIEVLPNPCTPSEPVCPVPEDPCEPVDEKPCLRLRCDLFRAWIRQIIENPKCRSWKISCINFCY